MATIEKRIGRWRAKVRKSGSSLSKTFLKKSDALQWAAETERSITLGFLHPVRRQGCHPPTDPETVCGKK